MGIDSPSEMEQGLEVDLDAERKSLMDTVGSLTTDDAYASLSSSIDSIEFAQARLEEEVRNMTALDRDKVKRKVNEYIDYLNAQVKEA